MRQANTLALPVYAIMHLWSFCSGTDLMVIYQRPLHSAPSTVWGLSQLFYNRQQTVAKAKHVAPRHTDSVLDQRCVG